MPSVSFFKNPFLTHFHENKCAMFLVFSTNCPCNFLLCKVFFLSSPFPLCEFLLCIFLLDHILLQCSTQHIFLTFYQEVIQSSPFSYAVLHKSSPSFFPVHIQSCHITSWVQTSIKCHYLSSLPVHVLKIHFCPIYNSSSLPHHNYSPSIYEIPSIYI